VESRACSPAELDRGCCSAVRPCAQLSDPPVRRRRAGAGPCPAQLKREGRHFGSTLVEHPNSIFFGSRPTTEKT